MKIHVSARKSSKLEWKEEENDFCFMNLIILVMLWRRKNYCWCAFWYLNKYTGFNWIQNQLKATCSLHFFSFQLGNQQCESQIWAFPGKNSFLYRCALCLISKYLPTKHSQPSWVMPLNVFSGNVSCVPRTQDLLGLL